MLKTKKIMVMFMVMMLITVNIVSVNAQTDVTSAKSYDEIWLQEIIAYETEVGKMIDEISGTTGEYTSLAISDKEKDREKFVNHILDIYDKLTPEQISKINGYLIGYADGVDDQSVRKFVNAQNAKTNTMDVSLMSYNPNDAELYASNYYQNYNLAEYPDLNGLGGDCANFVSQCIEYAGKVMDSQWYITKLNNNNPAPTTTAQLNASWALADPSPWISAKEFGIYWDSLALNTANYSVSDYLNLTDHSISGYATGDVVQIQKKAIINYYGYHTMLIVGIDGNDFLYLAHTSNRYDANLTDALQGYNSSSYKVKFFAMW